MSIPKDKPKDDDETPEVTPHSDEEEQPIITGDCNGFSGGCVWW
jgi:heat shock protein HslJ